MEVKPDPEIVVLAGDWHGNFLWFANYIIPAAVQVWERWNANRRIIIQLGDFGFDLAPDNPDLITMNMLLAEHDIELWWLDGNHEHWPDIRELMEASQYRSDILPGSPVRLRGFRQISYLPRGTRWTWHGKTWLAVGGAVSVDRLLRVKDVSWFQDEEITDDEAQRIIRDGPADILLSHDVPGCWFPPDLPPPAEAWKPVLPLAREHSRRLERIALECEVTRVFHGHYHTWRTDWYKEPYRGGTHVKVVGLREDGYDRNMLVCDARNP